MTNDLLASLAWAWAFTIVGTAWAVAYVSRRSVTITTNTICREAE